MKLTKLQKRVLEDLKMGGHEWYTPMMIGGGDCTYHSRVLSQLVKRGLVEKRHRNTLLNNLSPNRPRASMAYRLTNQQPHKDRNGDGVNTE